MLGYIISYQIISRHIISYIYIILYIYTHTCVYIYICKHIPMPPLSYPHQALSMNQTHSSPSHSSEVLITAAEGSWYLWYCTSDRLLYLSCILQCIIHMHVCMFIYLINIFICLSILSYPILSYYLSTYLPIYLSMYLYIYICIYKYHENELMHLYYLLQGVDPPFPDTSGRVKSLHSAFSQGFRFYPWISDSYGNRH